MTRIILMLGLIAGASLPCFSQSNGDLDTFFRQNIGFSQEEINGIRKGEPAAKSLPLRTPAEVFLFGAVHIHAAPERYVQYMRSLDLKEIHNPPQLADWKGFLFEHDDVQSLKNCKPGGCQLQLPASSIEELQRTINWSGPDLDDQVNGYLQKTAQERLLAYQREGNQLAVRFPVSGKAWQTSGRSWKVADKAVRA